MRVGSVGISAAGSAREHIKRLWKAYFVDPSQWWDFRDVKTNPKAPDSQHKTTNDFLWLDRTRNPSWVIPLLKKRDKERFSAELPPSLLEEGKDEKSSLHWRQYVLEKESQGCSSVASPACMLEEGAKKTSYLTWLKCTLEKEEEEDASFPRSPKADRTVYEEHGNSIVRQDSKLKQKKEVGREAVEEDKRWRYSCKFVGRVCDWHRLGLEDAIDALEKGSFSEPSVDTLVHIVCKCTKKKDVECALRLLAYMQRNGLDSHKVLGNFLVSMLVEVESMGNAQEVFDKMVSRNECTWNALVKGYVKGGDFAKAITLYKSVRRDRSIHLSGYTYVALLKACTMQKEVEMGQQVHADLSRERLLETNLFVGNALLDMYAKCSSLVEAQEVFDVLPVRDVVTWTSLIAGYIQHDRAPEALECYEQMQDAGISPNAFTYTCILKACGSLKYSILGREIHTVVEQEGLLKSSQIIGNALIDMYAKCGMLEKAQEVFCLLPVHDVISWNSLITGYAEYELSREALVSFEQMRSEGVPANAITYASVLKACAGIRDLKIGKEIHLEISRKGLLKKDMVLGSALVGMYMKCGLLEKAEAVFDKLPVRDAVAWTAMIAGYVQHDFGEKALACAKQMQVTGVVPDIITYALSLKACGNIGATNMGIGIHNEIADKGFLKRDALLGNAVIDMYTKCGMLAEAEEAFFSNPVHEVASWTALITGYAHLGDVKNALFAFQKMREDCINPTIFTLLSILNACGNAGLVDMAAAFLEAMSETFLFRQHVNISRVWLISSGALAN